MDMYVKLMSAYGKSAGIDFKFGGTVANTLDAHRVIWHWQEEKGEEVAKKIVDCMFIGSSLYCSFVGRFESGRSGRGGVEMEVEGEGMGCGADAKGGGSSIFAVL